MSSTCIQRLAAAVAIALAVVAGAAYPGAAVAPRGASARQEASLDARAASAVTQHERAMAVIGRLRQAKGTPDEDRAEALKAYQISADRLAFIGAGMTPLVTTTGSLESKVLSTDPRWAGLLVRQLAAHGVDARATVCASFSGSFPALNLATVVAVRALGARIVAISSVTASSWGANQAGLAWPEMEAAIVDAGVMTPASVAITLGGTRDAARDLQPDGQALARRIQAESAKRLGAASVNTTTLAEAIAARLDVYRRALGDRQATVYVNVGGNHASLGGAAAPLRHDGGWLLAMPEGGKPSDSVLHAFLADHVPVMSLLNIKALADSWGLRPR